MIDRRTFIKSSSLLAGGLAIYGNKIFAQEGKEKNNLIGLRKNVGIYFEKGGTIGWYKDGDTKVIIDTQFPDSAKNMLEQLKLAKPQRINYLFNTHNHNDHTMGNFYLKDFTDNIIAHENCPRLQEKQNKENLEKVVTANLTFKEQLDISLPKEKIKALHFGQAHTGSDIIIHFENANVVHLGDLVFNNVYPYIDNFSECSVENWIIVLEKAAKYFDKDTIFIFGHADKTEALTGKVEDVLRQRYYFEKLYLTVSKMIKDGKSLEQIENSESLPAFKNLIELWEGARKMNFGETAKQMI